jgi:hypothetical protein
LPGCAVSALRSFGSPVRDLLPPIAHDQPDPQLPEVCSPSRYLLTRTRFHT